MPTFASVSGVLVASLSLAAFARYSFFLFGLYPVFPELLCYSGYGRLFEALLAATLAIHLASIAYLARRPVGTTLLSGALMVGAVILSTFLLVNSVIMVQYLNQAQFDASCPRAGGPLLLRVFTLAYVGPVVSACLGCLTVAVGYRALSGRAF